MQVCQIWTANCQSGTIRTPFWRFLLGGTIWEIQTDFICLSSVFFITHLHTKKPFKSFNLNGLSNFCRLLAFAICGAGSNVTKSKLVEVSNVVMNKTSVTAGLKIPISIKGNNTSLDLTGGWESQNTSTTKETVTISVTDKDRELGNNFFNFFGSSPILEVSNNKVYLETTRYGCFDMCIIPVKRNLAQ